MTLVAAVGTSSHLSSDVRLDWLERTAHIRSEGNNKNEEAFVFSFCFHKDLCVCVINGKKKKKKKKKKETVSGPGRCAPMKDPGNYNISTKQQTRIQEKKKKVNSSSGPMRDTQLLTLPYRGVSVKEVVACFSSTRFSASGADGYIRLDDDIART